MEKLYLMLETVQKKWKEIILYKSVYHKRIRPV